MIIALYCVAAAMILGGVYSAFTGWDIVILERGWTQVLSGIIVATGGTTLAGIAFLAAHLRALNEALRSGVAKDAASRTLPDASPSSETRAAARAGASTAALAGTGKALEAVGVKNEPDMSGGQSVTEDALPPEQRVHHSDEFLARAAQAEDRAALEPGDPVPEGAVDPFTPPDPPVVPPPLPDENATKPAGDADFAQDAPPAEDIRAEDEARNMFADTLFADDVASRVAPDAAQADAPSADDPTPEKSAAPAEIDEHGPGIAQEPATSDAGTADEAVAPVPSELNPAVTSEQERFAALLAGQTHVDEQQDDLLQDEMPQDETPQDEVPNDETHVGEPAQPGELVQNAEPIPEPEEAAKPEVSIEPEIATAPAQATEPTPDSINEHPPEPESIAEPSQPEPMPEPEQEPPSAQKHSVIGTYESGGNTYTMYADGSIDARTPEGDYHFASLDELKTFIAEGGESRSA